MRLRPLIHGRDHEHGGADPTGSSTRASATAAEAEAGAACSRPKASTPA